MRAQSLVQGSKFQGSVSSKFKFGIFQFNLNNPDLQVLFQICHFQTLLRYWCGKVTTMFYSEIKKMYHLAMERCHCYSQYLEPKNSIPKRRKVPSIFSSFELLAHVTWFILDWEESNCCQSWANSQIDNYFHSKWQLLTVLSKNNCHFVNLHSFDNSYHSGIFI